MEAPPPTGSTAAGVHFTTHLNLLLDLFASPSVDPVASLSVTDGQVIDVPLLC